MGIKEKLPLLNSEKKGTRIAGYVVYAFIGLMVLGAILPSPDTGGETTTTSATTTPVEDETAATETTEDEEEEISPDVAWIVSTQVALSYLVDDMRTIGAAAEDVDIDAMTDGYSTFKAHIRAAQQIDADYEVSPDLETAQFEWREALDDYMSAANAGYTGAKDLDAESLEKSGIYMGMADKHIKKATDEIERYGDKIESQS